MAGAKGKTATAARVSAKVIRADGSVEDLGVVAGPRLQVIKSKIRRRVNKLWRQLFGYLQRGEK